MLTVQLKGYIIVLQKNRKKEQKTVDELNKEQAQDFGVVLYEKSNAKHALDAPTGKIGAKGWALRIYVIILGAGLFGWFLYSLIHQATDPEIGVVNAIISHIITLFVLFVAELIFMLTAFNGWGKLARFAARRNLNRKHGMEGVQARQLEEELAEVDANKEKECAIRVYRDLIIVVNDGEETLIHRAELRRVKCEPYPSADLRGYQVTFELYGEESVVASIPLLTADLPLFKKHFDSFEYTPAPLEKGYLKKRLPMVAFMFVVMLIGVAIIVVRSLVLPDIPLVIGVAFMSFGALLMLTQFSDIAVIGNGLIPICTGLLLMGLPIAIGLTIADLVEEITIASLFVTFTPVHAFVSVFFGFGPLLIIVGISGIVDCAKL